MDSLYAELWTYWGVLLTGLTIGFVSINVGIHFKTESSLDTGLSLFGMIVLFCTLIFGGIWGFIGAYSIHWITVPIVILGYNLYLLGKENYKYKDELHRCVCWLFLCIGLTYLVACNQNLRDSLSPSGSWNIATSGTRFAEDKDGWWTVIHGKPPPCCPRPEPVQNFWPENFSLSPQGILITPDGKPLRVLASGYLVPLFDSQNTEYPGGVVDIMKPFRAYFVLSKQDGALRVVESPYTKGSPAFWVRHSDCYIWATGLKANVKGEIKVYASFEQASKGGPELTPMEKYTSIDGLANVPAAKGFPPLSGLPLLTRKGGLAALLCPAQGGRLCWMNEENSQGKIEWITEKEEP